MAGATRLKYNINSRPRNNKKNKRQTIPVRNKLCKVEEITEVCTFNCVLKCSDKHAEVEVQKGLT